MRRDLTQGCASCRLRFSTRLLNCPVCHKTPLPVPDAVNQVQPTSRVAWVAKWVIVISFMPAFGVVLWTSGTLLKDGWPPDNAMDILIYLLGAMGVLLGAGIAIGIPFAIWYGIISFVRYLLKHIVDRPRRMLRITMETTPRSKASQRRHFMHRLWDDVEEITQQIRASQWALPCTFLIFLGLQLLAEIFGSRTVIKTTSWEAFRDSMITMVVINVLGVFVFGIFSGIFVAVAVKVKDFLNEPPHLFGYRASPPPVDDARSLDAALKDRNEVEGLVVPLDAVECAALETPHGQPFVAPLSGQPCFAFRLVGEADGQLVDDADATSFAVITEDKKRCVVSSADVVVQLPAEGTIRAENARGFLQKRGLPERKLSLAEAILREGDRVRLVGRRTDLRVGAAGYRGDERRMLLDAGDGLPVVLQAAKQTPP